MLNERRIIAGGVLFFSVISGIAPFFLVFAFIFSIVYPRYWEVLVAGFCFEVMYGAGGMVGWFPAPMFTATLVMFLLVALVRAKIRRT